MSFTSMESLCNSEDPTVDLQGLPSHLHSLLAQSQAPQLSHLQLPGVFTSRIPSFYLRPREFFLTQQKGLLVSITGRVHRFHRTMRASVNRCMWSCSPEQKDQISYIYLFVCSLGGCEQVHLMNRRINYLYRYIYLFIIY